MTLDECRRFYAEEIRLAAGVKTPALVEAFARVPRERFLGPGPWQVATADIGCGGVSYLPTDDADPRWLYHNVAVALDASLNLNNGQPGTLARWIDELKLKPGDRVYHVGCGVGYYTAIIAEVVGPTGRVVAIEFEPPLAARAKENLSSYRNVEVHAGDGAAFDPGTSDAIVINAGVTHPHPAWLDRMADGGRLIFPLTITMGPSLGKGVMFLITREKDRFPLRVVTVVAIYSCASVRDPALEPLLAKAFAGGALFTMKSVRRDPHDPV
ncbi:MAG TPA: methyltransferase domain-containing protein, partial [Candidatus Polarisedimenticolia bacterium]|nr:methyltransferase domain-containing protein [Candidatus Polarisedimenticolia bacterium]